MSLLSTMNEHLGCSPGNVDEPLPAETSHPAVESPVSQPEPVLYASTELDVRRIRNPHECPRDAVIEGKVYRRLDPDYFAWLRSRMTMARSAYHRGRLAKPAWDTLRNRFNRLQDLGIHSMGQAALSEAARTLDVRTYNPPPESPKSNWLYPSSGSWNFTQPVSNEALAKVDTIREKAVALGWSEARLYQNRGRHRFPLGEDYGLVCSVEGRLRIGEVANRFIEIIHPCPVGEPSILCFYNPDAPQPWNRMGK